MNYFTHDGDDDMSLADMMSMKINVSSPNANDKKVIFWAGFLYLFSITMYGVSMLFLCNLFLTVFSKKKRGRGREREKERERRSHGITIWVCKMGSWVVSIFIYNYTIWFCYLFSLSYPFSFYFIRWTQMPCGMIGLTKMSFTTSNYNQATTNCSTFSSNKWWWWCATAQAVGGHPLYHPPAAMPVDIALRCPLNSRLPLQIQA